MTAAQWAINVVPGEAPLSIFVRDGALIIRRATAQEHRSSGITGQRQVTANGVPQLPVPITTLSLWEWPLPSIEAVPGNSVNGTLTVRTESISDLAQPGAPPSATCRYQFSRSDSSLALSSSAAKASPQPDSAVSGLRQGRPANDTIQQALPAASAATTIPPPPGQTVGATNGLAPPPPQGSVRQEPLTGSSPLPAWDQTLQLDMRWKVLANFNSEAVLDRNTGLVWERNPGLFPMSFKEARQYCLNRSHGGHKGFRLPATAELTTHLDMRFPSHLPPSFTSFFNIAASSETPNSTPVFWAGDVFVEGAMTNTLSFVSPVDFVSGEALSGKGTSDYRYLANPSATTNQPLIAYRAWCVRGPANGF